MRRRPSARPLQRAPSLPCDAQRARCKMQDARRKMQHESRDTAVAQCVAIIGTCDNNTRPTSRATCNPTVQHATTIYSTCDPLPAPCTSNDAPGNNHVQYPTCNVHHATTACTLQRTECNSQHEADTPHCDSRPRRVQHHTASNIAMLGMHTATRSRHRAACGIAADRA